MQNYQERYRNEHKDTNYKEIFKTELMQMIQNLKDSGYRIYFITFTYRDLMSCKKFKKIHAISTNRFFAKMSKKLDKKIFQERKDIAPILITFVDMYEKRKEVLKITDDSIDKPHLHGFLFIHNNQYHIPKFEEIVKTGKLNEIWNKLKIENYLNCDEVNVKPVDDIVGCINYCTKPVWDEEYLKYLNDVESPYTLNCYDEKVKILPCIADFWKKRKRKKRNIKKMQNTKNDEMIALRIPADMKKELKRISKVYNNKNLSDVIRIIIHDYLENSKYT